LEVETDKTVLEIESFAAGVVTELCFQVNDEVRAGDVLAIIGEAPAQPTANIQSSAAVAQPPVEVTVEAASTEPATVPAPLPVVTSGTQTLIDTTVAPTNAAQHPAMPNAKIRAREVKIDLTTVKPANDLFIKVSDVEARHDELVSNSVPVRQPETIEAVATLVDTPSDAQSLVQIFQPAASTLTPSEVTHPGVQEYTVLPLSTMRTRIGARMVASIQQIPSFSATVRVDMTACIALRKRYQDVLGVKISYNDLMAKALAVAAVKYPLLNTRFENGELRLFKHTNVGIAVGVEDGLLVPVVRKVDTLGLSEIAAANQTNIANVRAGKLTPDAMGGASVSISNLGMYGIEEFTAIINPPESCIIAVGKIENAPKWTGESWTPVPYMNVTGSFDHRIMDGAYGAQILAHLKSLLEEPILMVV
jgi:pyruvate dehydrogenase E2 component (dihydrolipoamide acetyltransferase)